MLQVERVSFENTLHLMIIIIIITGTRCSRHFDSIVRPRKASGAIFLKTTAVKIYMNRRLYKIMNWAHHLINGCACFGVVLFQGMVYLKIQWYSYILHQLLTSIIIIIIMNNQLNNRETIDFKTLHTKNDVFTEMLWIFELVSWCFTKLTLNHLVYSLRCRLLTKIIYKNKQFSMEMPPKREYFTSESLCQTHILCCLSLTVILMLCLSSIRMNWKWHNERMRSYDMRFILIS